MCIVKKWLQWVHQVQDSLTLRVLTPWCLGKPVIYYLFVSFSLRQSPDGWILGFIFLSPAINLYRNDVNIDIENNRASRQETTHSLKFMMDKLIFRLPWWLSGKESTRQCRGD